MTVLRGTAYVMGRPREVVVRSVPPHVLVVEVLEEVEPAAQPSWVTP
jgi:hypothetical protein